MKYAFLRIAGKFDLPSQARVDWKIYSADKKLINGSLAPIPLAEAISKINHTVDKNLKTIIFVPGEAVSLHTINLSRQQTNYLKDSLPFIMEDQVADEVENLHFAHGGELSAKGDEITYPVAIIKKNYMEKWKKALADLKFPADEFIPEFLVLPEWSVILDKDKTLFKGNNGNGFAAEPDCAPLLVDAAIHLETSPPKISVYGAAAQITTFPQSSNIEAKPLKHSVTETLAAFYLENPNPGNLLNLLQGDFKKAIADFSAPFKWKEFAAAAAAGILIYATFNIGIAVYYKLAAANNRSEALAIYKTIAPEEAKSPDAEKHMQVKMKLLNGTGNGQDFLSEIAQVSAKISQLPQPEAISLTQIEYDSERGLALDIKVPSADIAEDFRKSLQQNGKTAKIESSNPEDGGIRAKVMVSE